jgi:hypothetical protein
MKNSGEVDPGLIHKRVRRCRHGGAGRRGNHGEYHVCVFISHVRISNRSITSNLGIESGSEQPIHGAFSPFQRTLNLTEPVRRLRGLTAGDERDQSQRDGNSFFGIIQE